MKKLLSNISKVAIIVATFWILDFLAHIAGVGESNFYFLSKFGNSILFGVIFCFVFSFNKRWKTAIFSAVFGTWVSFYYLVFSYSGFVQWLGIDARYTPPPFEIFGLVLSPVLWWVYHGLIFYLGTELSKLVPARN